MTIPPPVCTAFPLALRYVLFICLGVLIIEIYLDTLQFSTAVTSTFLFSLSLLGILGALRKLVCGVHWALNRAVFVYSSPPSIEDECLKCRRNFPAHFVDSDAISLITYGRRKVTLPIIRLYWVNSEACIQINSHFNKK